MGIYYVAGLPYSSELYHHGIKGQHWGRRRFQNDDGSLTAAGRERYGVGPSLDSFSGQYTPSFRNKVGMAVAKARRVYNKTNGFARSVGLNKAVGYAKSANKKTSNGTVENETAKQEQRKKAIKTAAVAVGIGLAAYGAYKVNKISKDAKAYRQQLDLISRFGDDKPYWSSAGIDSANAKSLMNKYINSSLGDKIKQVYNKQPASKFNSKGTMELNRRVRETLKKQSKLREGRDFIIGTNGAKQMIMEEIGHVGNGRNLPKAYKKLMGRR